MATLQDARTYLAEYERRYRHPDQPALIVSEIYDLFPGRPIAARAVPKHKWPESWPSSDRRGVYMILDAKLGVRYVGKASMRSSIGARLSTYFAYAKDRSCKVVHTGWGVEPRFVTTIAVPDESTFEAPAIEEYLIVFLRPPDNSVGM